MPLTPKKTTRNLTNGFILFHLAAFACWSNPLNKEFRNPFVEWIAPYMEWTGLWQSWAMFAPDPMRVNAHLEALIIFRDGSQAIWSFPRTQKQGYLERYLKERYRKWSSDYVRVDAYGSLWPDTARFIARLHRKPENPPVEVRLIRRWMIIPPPLPGNRQVLPKEYRHDQSHTFFVFSPTAEDLA